LVWTFDDEVNQTCIDNPADDSDPSTSEWMMRISDNNFERVFLGTMSRD